MKKYIIILFFLQCLLHIGPTGWPWSFPWPWCAGKI